MLGSENEANVLEIRSATLNIWIHLNNYRNRASN